MGMKKLFFWVKKETKIEIILNLTNIVQFRSLVFLPLDK